MAEVRCFRLRLVRGTLLWLAAGLILSASSGPWASGPATGQQPGSPAGPEVSRFSQKLVEAARAEAGRRPWYRSAYYKGGYPPENEGVCTDVIWRAFRDAGVDLKAAIDADIRRAPRAYPRASQPDRNIDFRRVPNQTAYFRRHARIMGTDITPGDPASTATWLPGDIVVFANPDHIAILSNKRNRSGVPYLLHNDGPWASEGDDFMRWYKRGIVARFRYGEK